MTALTFDVDYTWHAASSSTTIDEMEAAFPVIRTVLQSLPRVRTTWFVRVDAHIAALFGRPDYILVRHARPFDWLREHGHEIAWHHHAYEHADGKWRPCSEESVVVALLGAASDAAREHGLEVARMGWGFHTNRTMDALEHLGWRVDSSAIPRPSYSWDAVPRDWSITPQTPYLPARADFRAPGAPARAVLEIPITTVTLPMSGDDQAGVRRYINPAYHPEAFRAALAAVPAGVEPVLVTHPYEVLASAAPHPLLAFDAESWRSNMELLAATDTELSTMSELAALAAPVATGTA